MSYNAGSRLTTSVNGASVTTYTFDANGNMILESVNGNSTSYIYDPENRLTQYVNGLETTTYTYDGTGLRRSKQLVQSGSTQTTTYIWDGTDYLGEVN